MSRCSKVAEIDLSVSAARVNSAKALAEAQLRCVEAAVGGADAYAIDMLFLLQENVLVLSETHAMLVQLAVQGAPPSRRIDVAAPPLSPVRKRIDRQAGVAVLVFLVALIASVCALEIIDPAPMGAAAAWLAWP